MAGVCHPGFLSTWTATFQIPCPSYDGCGCLRSQHDSYKISCFLTMAQFSSTIGCTAFFYLGPLPLRLCSPLWFAIVAVVVAVIVMTPLSKECPMPFNLDDLYCNDP
ncbi:MAG: hypothetical protein J3Q66DRAFT_391696 [Benniella sp.]|nr:MAG: hypothetical protein J3Q66DRAFT_391696 [Benniella sp.]